MNLSSMYLMSRRVLGATPEGTELGILGYVLPPHEIGPQDPIFIRLINGFRYFGGLFAWKKKVRALEQLRSQNYEGGAGGSDEKMAANPSPDDKEAHFEWLIKSWTRRNGAEADKCRDLLIQYYGKEHGAKVKHAETFAKRSRTEAHPSPKSPNH